jgi:serine/threonine-protein kinase
MTLAPGVRLGPYEILSAIGAGGMGEVYKARDTKLGRDVALKILPEQFATDPDRLARFRREAQVLASLNHPNIAAIHGFEEANSVHALVLELVEGQTLADRIAQGPIPLDEALPIAKQMAEALEAAHEHGIIHRDLKPANIKLRPDGTVKVLDFGLAKTLDSQSIGPDASQSLTITSPAMTEMGVILGTAAYMSPEQAKGKPADKRSDVWAFGCVLYEMLSGKRAFEGNDVSDLIVAVLGKEPNWTALPSITPSPILRLLKRSLERDPRRRVPGMAVARFEIDDALAPTPDTDTTQPYRSVRRTLGYVALAVVATAALVGFVGSSMTSVRGPSIARLAIVLPGGEEFTNTNRQLVAISPDGTRVAYVANNRIYVRTLDQLVATPIPGTEAERIGNPFFSPDGQWIGFWAGGQLKKVSLNGGTPVRLCEAGELFGATWGLDDNIVFGQGPQGIWRVSATGGTPEHLVKVDAQERAHGPQMLPGGFHLIFTVGRNINWEGAQIVVQSLKTGMRNVLVPNGRDARYIPTGHLVYASQGSLHAVSFDPETLKVGRGSVALVDGVAQANPSRNMTQTAAVHFSLSATGALVYVPDAVTVEAKRTIVWVDRLGQEESLGAPPRAYIYPRLSPDGTRVALDVRDQENDIWVWHLAARTLTRVTSDPASDIIPLWTLDGRRLLFTSNRGAYPGVFWQAADGSGIAERLTEQVRIPGLSGLSPDGTRVIGGEQETAVSGIFAYDMWILSLARDSRTSRPPDLEALLRTRFDELNGVFSPDGRWLAYQSNATGRWEIYVRPFPVVEGGQWQVSTSGGTEPLFAPSGQELFYRAPNEAIMGVTVSPGTSWTAAEPKQLVPDRYFGGGELVMRSYDVSRDGRRFLMIKDDPAPSSISTSDSLILVQNWFEELKRRVPTN